MAAEAADAAQARRKNPPKSGMGTAAGDDEQLRGPLPKQAVVTVPESGLQPGHQVAEPGSTTPSAVPRRRGESRPAACEGGS
jgi:hypothetical protein